MGAAVIIAPPAVDDDVEVEEVEVVPAAPVAALDALDALLIWLANSELKLDCTDANEVLATLKALSTLLFADPVAVAATLLKLKYALAASCVAVLKAPDASLTAVEKAPAASDVTVVYTPPTPDTTVDPTPTTADTAVERAPSASEARELMTLPISAEAVAARMATAETVEKRIVRFVVCDEEFGGLRNRRISWEV